MLEMSKSSVWLACDLCIIYLSNKAFYPTLIISAVMPFPNEDENVQFQVFWCVTRGPKISKGADFICSKKSQLADPPLEVGGH